MIRSLVILFATIISTAALAHEGHASDAVSHTIEHLGWGVVAALVVVLAVAVRSKRVKQFLLQRFD